MGAKRSMWCRSGADKWQQAHSKDTHVFCTGGQTQHMSTYEVTFTHWTFLLFFLFFLSYSRRAFKICRLQLHQFIYTETGLIFNSIRRPFTTHEYEIGRLWQGEAAGRRMRPPARGPLLQGRVEVGSSKLRLRRRLLTLLPVFPSGFLRYCDLTSSVVHEVFFIDCIGETLVKWLTGHLGLLIKQGPSNVGRSEPRRNDNGVPSDYDTEI